MSETNPLLTVFNPFLTSKNFRGQMERVVRGSMNVGFVDKSFQAMMKKVGWRGGEAWCMYYVKLVYMQFFSFDREFLAKNFNGSTSGTLQNIINLNAKGDKRYIFIKANTPQIGDIISLQGHVALVQEVISPTVVKTIEGNTSVRGVREGDGVSENRRTLVVGKRSFNQLFRGYIRRNFTQDELNRLFFDETEKTLKFK
jgi:hypothetical protein